MRVLHLLPNAGEGGTQRLAAELVIAHREAGHEVAVATADGPLRETFGEPVFDLPVLHRSPRGIVKPVVALSRVTERWQPDVVHAHTVRAAPVVSLATLRGHRVSGIVTAHGMPEAAVAAGARVLRLSGLPVVSVGPGLATAFAHHGLSCSVIPNGVSPAPPPADAAALRQEWAIPTSSHVAVAVGRLVDQKNHLVAVRALAHLPDVTLVILGEGPLRGALEAEANRLGIADRLRLPGFRSDARAVMGAAEVMVMPSVWEGFGTAALEALAAATPLVAARGFGFSEWLSDGVDSLVVPVGDVSAVAQAIRRLLDDRRFSERIAEGAKQTASRYTVAATSKRYLDTYEELIATERARLRRRSTRGRHGRPPLDSAGTAREGLAE